MRALVLVAAGFLVLVLVASGDVVHVFHDPPPSAGDHGHVDSPPPGERPAAEDERPESHDEGGSTNWLAGVALVLVVLLGALLVWSLVSTWVNWRPDGLRRRQVEPIITPLPLVEPPVVVLDEDAQLAALLHGSPRNAIVACWLRMEEDVARAGLPKHPAETSTEYTTRVLSSSSLDPAVDELAALYREARFSRHELAQEHRDRPLSALQRIHASLLASTPAGDS
jgi:hypothetical protein